MDTDTARTQSPVLSDGDIDWITGWVEAGLFGEYQSEVILGLIASLRREREIRRALPEYLPIRYYPGSADVPAFYTCQVCNEQGESARSVAHPADCPWRALLALDEGTTATGDADGVG